MSGPFDPVAFGTRVLAGMNGRSCREVAREAGVSAATLNRVTRGEMPSVPVYLTLSAWLTDPVESAAQDMLEALQAAVECGIVPISSASEGGAMRHSRQVQVADMIRAAIAKATPHQHGAGNGEKHGG